MQGYNIRHLDDATWSQYHSIDCYSQGVCELKHADGGIDYKGCPKDQPDYIIELDICASDCNPMAIKAATTPWGINIMAAKGQSKVPVVAVGMGCMMVGVVLGLRTRVGKFAS